MYVDGYLCHHVLWGLIDTTDNWQQLIESPIESRPFSNWCYLLPKAMSRDSSCSDVIELLSLTSMFDLLIWEES